MGILRVIGRVLAFVFRAALAHPDIVLSLAARNPKLARIALIAVQTAASQTATPDVRQGIAVNLLLSHARQLGVRVSTSEANLLVEAAYQAAKKMLDAAMASARSEQ